MPTEEEIYHHDKDRNNGVFHREVNTGTENTELKSGNSFVLILRKEWRKLL
jgi:hypothetical protein